MRRSQAASRSSSLKLARDRVEHHEHGLDGRVEPPQVEIPTLVLDPQRRAARQIRGRGVLDDPLAEQPRTRARCIREPGPWLGVAEPAAAEREVPVQQKQRGQPLLPIERLERPVLHLAVDEVETDRLAICQGLVQSLEEGAANVVDTRIAASLGIVPLDQRDLDTRDLARRRRRAAGTWQRTTSGNPSRL